MRSSKLFVVPTALIALATFAFSPQTTQPRHTSNAGALFAQASAVLANADARAGRSDTAWRPEGPTDWSTIRQLGGLGIAGPSARQLAAIGRQARATQRETRRTRPAIAKPAWHWIGPPNIGGRVTDIVADPATKDVLYAATASGGVWKSTDGGMNYRSIWPKANPQAIGALAMGPDGALWAGTGEANPGGGSVTFGGDGVYVSRDHGAHWKHVGLTNSVTIGRIAVDPKDAKHVLVAVTGNLYRPGGVRGLYETRDGGKTWTRTLTPPNATTGAVDIAIDPNDPNTILVTTWDRIRHPDVRYYTGVGSGIWRSTDGGKTYTRLGPEAGLPPENDQIGRIGVAFAPSDPSVAYAVYANNQVGSYELFFKSIDGGAHWVVPPGAATLGESQSVYGWWFGKLWVDPQDANHVFVTGLMLFQTTDGGASFTPDTDMHSDHHAIAFDPFDEQRVWDGDDGGVYVSKDDGGSWTHAKRQPWMQFFRIDVFPGDTSRVNGGMQDNGSTRSWSKPAWDGYYGGDGVENVINPKVKANVFACSQYGSCGRSDDGGDTMQDMNNTFARAGWLTPIVFQPGSKDVVYWGGDRVLRSTDRGRNWSEISPDLGKGEVGREVNPLYAGHWGSVQAIGLNKSNPKVIYAGTDQGYLWKTTDLGANWTEITSKSLPKRWITEIAVRQKDPNQLYVTFSGYHQGDVNPYVLRSFDGGKTWQNVTKNLPHASVNDIVLAGSRLFVATDVGVYTSTARRVHWYYLGHGLPNIPINDLRYIGRKHALWAGTFGRGIWTVRVPA